MFILSCKAVCVHERIIQCTFVFYVIIMSYVYKNFAINKYHYYYSKHKYSRIMKLIALILFYIIKNKIKINQRPSKKYLSHVIDFKEKNNQEQIKSFLQQYLIIIKSFFFFFLE